ncbi:MULTISPECIES: metal-dependent hydrolase family protein [Pseudonocardia]|uniref:Imidazolonepropionase n=2 Tax=Pseudonocardia TaxID=1847 RepID=A0A1Y2MNP5_PSEAH|nr:MULTISPECIES: amidohydrolase family protein [Pseudonocardia]OSY36874.1 imidazolonepropionase [Pseudonocardia autotrophica]TDN76864.1 imidazolonepropionase-like amidohydrolase [Pseudonocardia autotrophica]BBG00866.1 Xaa-Pro dipeptidase [Pseudonocardia autotrophica]GEC28867.1 Xaa-Pro dipeptidase [Pseudonocardia saturnea]
MNDIAIEGGLLWAGPHEHHRDALVYIRGGTVVYAGRAGGIAVPEGTPRVDATGCTVLPGLIDAHVHLTTNSDHDHVVAGDVFRGQVSRPGKLLHGLRNAHRALAAGFTSLRVMGHRDVGEIELRDFVECGLAVGPRLVVSPWWITMTNGHGDLFYPPYTPRQQWDTADGVEECRKIVRLQAREGADFIKVMASGGMSRGEQPHWPNYSVAELAAIVDEAHDLDLRVAAHALSIEGIRRSLEAGVDSIEHGSYLDQDTASEMARRGTFLVPTMAFNDWCQREGTARGLTAAGVEALRDAHDRTIESFELARRAGVRIVMGTDSSGTLCPFGAHARELELYVRYGMTTDEALATATVNAAALLDRPDLGVLREGGAGDAVVVAGDVLADIGVLGQVANIKHVVRSGRDLSDHLRATSDVLDIDGVRGVRQPS